MIYRCERDQKLNIFELVLMIFFEAYFILPSMSLKISFLIPLFAGTMYTLYLCTRNTRFGIIAIRYIIIIIIIALLYTFFTEATSISQVVSNRALKRFVSKFYQLLMMYFPAAMFWRIHRQGSEKQKKWILIIAFALVGYVTAVTLREIVVNPNVTRTWSEFAEYGLNNVGGYYFVYCIPIVIPLLLMLYRKASKAYKKVALILAITILFGFLLESQYTLALLMAIVAVVIVAFKGTLDARSKAMFLVSIIVLMVFLPYLLHWLSTVVPSEHMSTRLYEMYAFLWYRDTSGYNLMGRLELYCKAVMAFFRSPLWGNRELNFDGHATLLMVLADLGLLGGIPFYYIFFSMRKMIGKTLEGSSSEFTPIFLVLVIMGFTNPINAALPTSYMVWFVSPLLIEILNLRKDIENNAKMEN